MVWRWNDINYQVMRIMPHNHAPDELILVYVNDGTDTPFTVSYDDFNQGLNGDY